MTQGSEAFQRHGGPVLASLLVGVSAADAAVKHGVTERTVARWLARGREAPGGPYGDFARAVDEVRAVSGGAGPMDAVELARVVSEQARAGSVAAMKLRWEMLRAAGVEPPAVEIDEFDELKARRRGRG